MTTLETHLATRRSIAIPSLVEPGPSREELDRILQLAMRVPDHGKLAPWRFLVIRGAARSRLGAATAAIAQAKEGPLSEARQAFEEARFTRAPLVIAVISRAAPHFKIPEWEQVLSAGAVTMNLMHAVYALGYAANWITEWVSYDEDAKRALAIGADEKVAGFIYIGTPGGTPVERPRPTLESVVSEAPAEDHGERFVKD